MNLEALMMDKNYPSTFQVLYRQTVIMQPFLIVGTLKLDLR
jgi:hypothetical protein